MWHECVVLASHNPQNNTVGVVIAPNTTTFNALLNGTANSTGPTVTTSVSNGTAARVADTVDTCTGASLGCATCGQDGCVTCPLGFQLTKVRR